MPYYTIGLILTLTCFCWVILVITKTSGEDIVKKKVNRTFWGYELYYSDQKLSERQKGVIYSTLLKSEKYGLAGKPDFIYKHKRKKLLMPVELKSGKIGDGLLPHKGDLMQLCTYFLIIEETFEIKPITGRIVYSDCMFIVKNSKRLRAELAGVLKEMRDMLKAGEKATDISFIKCKYCIMQGTVCEYCHV